MVVYSQFEVLLGAGGRTGAGVTLGVGVMIVTTLDVDCANGEGTAELVVKIVLTKLNVARTWSTEPVRSSLLMMEVDDIGDEDPTTPDCKYSVKTSGVATHIRRNKGATIVLVEVKSEWPKQFLYYSSS